MQISGTEFLPQMGTTNTTPDGSQLITDEYNFQNALEEATSKLNKSTNSAVMTEEELAQRDKEIKDASVQLEAILLKMMYNEMWKTVPKDELFGDDNAMDIYRDMYHEELTTQIAEEGGIGLADFIYEQMTKTYR